VLDVLSALVDKSLVNAEECGPAMRYSFLETLREYARERLDEAGEGDWVRNRHLDYFLALTKSNAPLLAGGEGQSAWMECLDADQANLRQALAWAIAQDSPHSLQLAGALWPFWELSAPLAADQGWLQRATQISAREALIEQARSLARAGSLAWQQGDPTRSRWLHELALALYRQSDDRRGLASALNNLAAQFHAQADYERAEALYTEGLQMARQSGDGMLISASLNNLGIVAMETQRYEAAEQFLLEALEAARQDGNQTKIAIALHNLGEVERSRGAYAEALSYYQHSLAESQQAGYRLGLVVNNWGCGAMHFRLGEGQTGAAWLRQGVELAGALETPDWAARCLAWLGLVESQHAAGERAVRLLAAAEALHPARDYLAASGIAPAEYEQALAGVRGEIGEAAFELAWQEGRKYGLPEAVAFALETA
jgi:tetratricopeptide (TPR) repeat protein